FDSGVVIINSRGEGLFIVRPRAGFEIEKSQPVGTLEPGETITYTITVSNTGIKMASNVVVTDTLNGNDVVVSGAAAIAPGDAATYTFTYTISEGDCGNDLSNMASVSADLVPVVELDAPVVTPVNCGGMNTYYQYIPVVPVE
ncbi:MAG: CARDB domain-containing protein, partial [Candidatus Promineifilaceae bacterium]